MQVGSPSDAAFRRHDIPLALGGLQLHTKLGRMGHSSVWRFPRYCGSSGDLPAGPTFLPAPAGGREWLQILGGRLDWAGTAGWRLPSPLRPCPGSECHCSICMDWHLEPSATPSSIGPATGWFFEPTVPSDGYSASWGDHGCVCLALASFFGQGGISPPLWAAAPRRHPHYSEMQIDLEATHTTDDSNLRMASFTAAPHDLGRASTHASRLSSELPSWWWGPEDCSHLFFQCSLVQEAWAGAAVARLSVTSEEAFWSSLSGGFFTREANWRRIFATLWAIWIHKIEVVFRGITPSGDAIIHTVEGFYLSWHRGGVGPSNYIPLLR